MTSHVIEFSGIAMSRKDLPKTDYFFNRLQNKDNVALLGLLKLKTPLENSKTPPYLLVANAHIHWDPQFADIKLLQSAMLMEEVASFTQRHSNLLPLGSNHKISKTGSSGSSKRLGRLAQSGKRSASPPSSFSYFPTIVCGDFNSEPGSGVCDYMCDASVPARHPDFAGYEYGRYTQNGISHQFSPMKLLYKAMGKNVMSFTNWTPDFKGIIDHAWISGRYLKYDAVLAGIDRSWAQTCIGFPNGHVPSDHVPILFQCRYIDAVDGVE